jgi:hypothetical protein
MSWVIFVNLGAKFFRKPDISNSDIWKHEEARVRDFTAGGLRILF